MFLLRKHLRIQIQGMKLALILFYSEYLDYNSICEIYKTNLVRAGFDQRIHFILKEGWVCRIRTSQLSSNLLTFFGDHVTRSDSVMNRKAPVKIHDHMMPRISKLL